MYENIASSCTLRVFAWSIFLFAMREKQVMNPAAAIAVNQMALPGKLEKNDKRWFQYNSSFENCTVTPSELAAQIRTGHGYTSWHEPHFRHHQNWQKSQFIAVDLDTEDERSSFNHILRNTLVVSYGTLVHTTASHLPQAPRSRIIFFLDKPIENAEGYSAACTFLTRCLGGDKACTDPSRGFFGAKDCMCEEIGSVLPLDVVRKMYRAFAEKAPKRKETFHPATIMTDDEKYERIAEAITYIPPWGVSYDQWFTLLCAIKNELGDAGLNLAMSWSTGDEGDVAKHWKYIRRGGGKVAKIGTIIHIASLHGFNPKGRQSEVATPETSRPL